MGVAIDGTERADRVDAILSALQADGHTLVEATAQPDDALLAVHDPELLEHLRTASARWAEGPYEREVGQTRVVPYLFPTPAMTAGLPIRPAVAVHADAGRFGYDTMTLVGPGTWEAARSAVDCAVQAASVVSAGEPLAYALCRPPGHHATPAGFGGSCYLNNAAVAATALQAGGHDRIGIVDIDAHQGNGTAAIFWERGDVRYGSVHVDPGAGWFPHLLGYADETGAGARRGRDPQPAAARGHRRRALARGGRRPGRVGGDCDALVVSLGVDAAEGRPREPAPGHRRRLPRGRPAARRHRAARGRRPGGRLPPADARRPRLGVPRRARLRHG